MIKMINYFTEEPQPVHVGGFKININGMISFYIQYNFLFISIHHLNRPKTHKKSFASVKLAPTCWNSSQDRNPSSSESNFLNANSTLSIFLSSSRSSTLLSEQKQASIEQVCSLPPELSGAAGLLFCTAFFVVCRPFLDFLGLSSRMASPIALHSKSRRCVSLANCMKSSRLIPKPGIPGSSLGQHQVLRREKKWFKNWSPAGPACLSGPEPSRPSCRLNQP